MIAETSITALQSVSLKEQKTLADKIFAVVVLARRAGVVDMSMREIQRDMELVEGKRIDLSTISARVNGLVAAKRLHRQHDAPRACSFSGRLIFPLCVANDGDI